MWNLTIAILAILLSTNTNSTREQTLPFSHVQLTTVATKDVPATVVTAKLKLGTKQLESLVIIVGDKTHEIAQEAILQIGPVNLSTTEVRTEVGRSGQRWFSVVFRPAEPTEHPTWYNVSIKGDAYENTSKVWDTKEGEVTRRNNKVLHKRQ